MDKKEKEILKRRIEKRFKNKPFALKMPNGETFYAVIRGVDGDQLRMEMCHVKNGKYQPVGFGPSSGFGATTSSFPFNFPVMSFLPFFSGLFNGFPANSSGAGAGSGGRPGGRTGRRRGGLLGGLANVFMKGFF